MADAADRLLAHQEDGGRVLLSVGGVWDTQRKCYVDDPANENAAAAAAARRAIVHRVHAGQIAALRWAASWIAAHLGGEALAARVLEPTELDPRHVVLLPILAALFYGGRRGGKTNLALWLAIAFAIAKPGSRVWLIAESIPTTEELDLELQDMIPVEWGRDERLGAPHWRYTLPNGSTITLRSAHEPQKLKKGRCDFAVLNEAQNIDEKAFVNVLGCLADDGGLAILAANPPEKTIGDWVESFHDDVMALRSPSVDFHFDARLNHHVANNNLAAISRFVDDDTFRREVLGQFVGRRERVFYPWLDAENVRPTPQLGDITRMVMRKTFGVERDYLVGADFQLQPHMAAAILKFFLDPDAIDPNDPDSWLAWFVDEVVVPEGDENDLITALEVRGYRAENTIVVADATGEYQDGSRTPGKTSWGFFHKRGWMKVFRPEEDLVKKNPPIVERIAAFNARIKSADMPIPYAPSKRRLFSDPLNRQLNEAIKRWPNKNGAPNKRSGYAHLGDAASYPIMRVFPRRLVVKPEVTIVRDTDRPSRREEFEVY